MQTLKSKKIVQVILFSFSLLISIVLAELLLNLLPNEYWQNMYRSNIWDHMDNSNFSDEAFEYFINRYSYDANLGFIRTEIEQRISDNQSTHYDLRILVLGDSVTEQGIFTQLLNDALAEEYQDKSISVLNAGVVGYDTELEKKLYQRIEKSYNPDLVVLQISCNDFTNTPIVVQSNQGFIGIAGRRFVNKHWFDKSNLYRLLSLTSIKWTENTHGVGFDYRNIEEPLRELTSLLNESEVEFVLVLHPLYYVDEYTLWCDKHYDKLLNEYEEELMLIDLRPGISVEEFELLSEDTAHPTKYAEMKYFPVILDTIKDIIHTTLYKSDS